MSRRLWWVFVLALAVTRNALHAQVVQLNHSPQNTAEGTRQTSATFRVCSQGSNLGGLEGGLVEMFSSGALQASTQLVRLCIGEPGRLRIPVYFFVGVPGKTSGTNASNDGTMASLLNPLGGYFNVNATDAFKIWPRGQTTIKYSSFSATYQVGGKYLNGRDSASGSGVTTTVVSAMGGLRYQTGAIDLDDKDTNNVGLFFAQITLGTNTSAEAHKLEQIFGQATGNNVGSLQVETGIEIQRRLKARVGWLHSYTNLGRLDKNTFKFSLDYLPREPSSPKS